MTDPLSRVRRRRWPPLTPSDDEARLMQLAHNLALDDVREALRSDDMKMVGARALARRKYDVDYDDLPASRQVECRVEARAVLAAAAGDDRD